MKKGGLCQTEITRLIEPAEDLRGGSVCFSTFLPALMIGSCAALLVTNSFVVSAVAGDAYPVRTQGGGLIVTPHNLFVRSSAAGPEAWKQLSKACEKAGFDAPMVVALPRGFTMRRIPSVVTTKTVPMGKFYNDRFTVKSEFISLRPQLLQSLLIPCTVRALS